jgi:hypothetical protein
LAAPDQKRLAILALAARSLLTQLREIGAERLFAIGKAHPGEVGVACWLAACDVLRITDDLARWSE